MVDMAFWAGSGVLGAHRPRVDIVEALAHPRVRRDARDTERRMQVSRHHGIPAAADVSVELQQRWRLEAETLTLQGLFSGPYCIVLFI
ncbi:MAG: hypothetical protein OXE85_12630 [Roseovarius sp.]|nr:hypothetical protein [Roseovarius sp.]